MPIRDILLLGNPRLYELCAPVEPDEVVDLRPVVLDLQDTLHDYRRRHGAGRAIAAPQIGVMKRLVYMHVDEPVALVNPVLEDLSPEMIELWDDCMSFPGLRVRVRRHRRCRVVFRDLDWRDRSLPLVDGLSELLQHECDHLDGVLAVSRAVGPRAFAYASELADPPPGPIPV